MAEASCLLNARRSTSGDGPSIRAVGDEVPAVQVWAEQFGSFQAVERAKLCVETILHRDLGALGGRWRKRWDTAWSSGSERVHVLVPYVGSYEHFEYSDGRGGGSLQDVGRGRQVELQAGPCGLSLGASSAPSCLLHSFASPLGFFPLSFYLLHSFASPFLPFPGLCPPSSQATP